MRLTVTRRQQRRHQPHRAGVCAPNRPPAAAFTANVHQLPAAFDAAGTSDPDGTVASYAWDFGDALRRRRRGGVARLRSGRQLRRRPHRPRQRRRRGNRSRSRSRSPSRRRTLAIAADAFGRTAAQAGALLTPAGSGRPPARGNYSGGLGRRIHDAAHCGRLAPGVLSGVSAPAANVQAKASADKIASGGGMFLGIIGRKAGADEYRAKLKISATGSASLYLTSVVGGTGNHPASRSTPGSRWRQGTSSGCG